MSLLSNDTSDVPRLAGVSYGGYILDESAFHASSDPRDDPSFSGNDQLGNPTTNILSYPEFVCNKSGQCRRNLSTVLELLRSECERIVTLNRVLQEEIRCASEEILDARVQIQAAMRLMDKIMSTEVGKE
jgi:hypothetical protein